MPIETPFHARTSKLCHSMNWKDWAGYYAVSSYDTCHEQEYFAYRHAAGLMDVTPLFKYEIKGRDAKRLLLRILSKDITNLKVGKISYCCWCDDEGKMMDDGTVQCLDEDHYRLTAAEPTLHWLVQNSLSYQVNIEDITQQYGMLALQGPLSRDILRHIVGSEIEQLKFFSFIQTTINGNQVTVSRTGYTGDLGYELWCKNEAAHNLYDTLMEAGKNYQILAAGLDALDVARIEAGFMMNGVDYFSSNHCVINSRKSTPFEMGLSWCVNLERDPFIGQQAMIEEKKHGSVWSFVGLEYDWVEYEKLFAKHKLGPETPHGAWRTGIPVYDNEGEHIGQATSGTWSPTLKQNIALASIKTNAFKKADTLQIEATCEFERLKCPVAVKAPMFFNPERKRA